MAGGDFLWFMTQVDKCDFLFVVFLMVMPCETHLLSSKKLLTQSAGLMDDLRYCYSPQRKAASFTGNYYRKAEGKKGACNVQHTVTDTMICLQFQAGSAENSNEGENGSSIFKELII